MAVTKIRLGTNEDGTPHYLYQSDDPTKAVVITGPVSGIVSLPDGTSYDVSEPMIEVEPGHELLVSDEIGKIYESEGHPLLPGEQFVLVPSDVSHDADGNPSETHAAEVSNPDTANDPASVLAALTQEG
jgi:hypothetical protein